MTSSGQSVGLYGIGKQITVADNQSLHMTFNDVVTINTGVAGNLAYAWALATTTTVSGIGTLATACPRMATMANLYRQFIVKQVTIEYVPAVASTDKGMVSMGYDPAPLSGIPSGYSSVVRHSVSKMFDIKTNVAATYRPSLDRKKDPRYTSMAAGTDEDEYSFGVFQLFTIGNSVPATTNFGFLRFNVTVEFLGPY